MGNRIKIFKKLAGEGFSLIPTIGKKPFENNWQKYCESRREFNEKDFINRNAGIACGPASGVIALDIDCAKSTEILFKHYNWPKPNTRSHKTGSGGLHYLFSYPNDGKKYKCKSLKHPAFKTHTVFDVRGLGGQVIAPGSIHPDTKMPYEIKDDLELEPLPDYLREFILGTNIDTSILLNHALPEDTLHECIQDIKNIPEETKNFILNGVEKGERSEAGFSVICTLLRKNYSEEAIKYIFDYYPIGEKYREKNQSKEKWLRDEIGRAKSKIHPTSIHSQNLLEFDFENLRKKAQELLDSKRPTAVFSSDLLPKTVKDYVDSLCKTTDADPGIITMSVVCTLSAILKKRVCIPKDIYFQELYPNLWMISVLESGGFKTTALKKGSCFANQLREDIQEKLKSFSQKLENSDLSEEDRKQIENEIEKTKKSDIFLPQRITPEALLKHLSDGYGGMIQLSEFGQWLQNMEKKVNLDLKGLFTDFYDVKCEFDYLTKTNGSIKVIDPFITISAVSTLTWVNKSINRDDFGSGFFARFLIFYPPQSDKIPPALPKEMQEESIEEKKLYEVVKKFPTNKMYKLSEESCSLFDNYHNAMYEELETLDHKTQEILKPYVKRWSPYLLKLAMVFQSVIDVEKKRMTPKHREMEIEPEALWAAKSIMDYATKSTTFLLQNELGESDNQRKCRIVLEYIAKKDGSYCQIWCLRS